MHGTVPVDTKAVPVCGCVLGQVGRSSGHLVNVVPPATLLVDCTATTICSCCLRTANVSRRKGSEHFFETTSLQDGSRVFISAGHAMHGVGLNEF